MTTRPRKPSAKAKKDDPQERIQQTLVKTYIALPLVNAMEKDEEERKKKEKKNEKPSPDTQFNVIIDANLDFPGARAAARQWILQVLGYLIGEDHRTASRLKPGKNKDQPHYVFARLTAQEIRALVELDGRKNAELKQRMADDEVAKKPGPLAGLKIPLNAETPEAVAQPGYSAPRAVYQIWEDFEVRPLIVGSVATCKADAARAAFRATGRDIVWAVIDSGIEGGHPHFKRHGNLEGSHKQWHRDFTDNAPGPDDENQKSALRDEYGHGTHVAGIIAGEIDEQGAPKDPIVAYRRVLDPTAPLGRREINTAALSVPAIAGMAPQAKLVSLKVLGAGGSGSVSSIIMALNWIQEINGYGRRIQIHGVNLSVGYPFDAEWFACGQSQLCVEVDRLVRSGVVVVVAAGNRGYGQLPSAQREKNLMGGLALSISDPGNAEMAITVGSTHREMPHLYGVSYFSGKGPTGDGRLKPDLLAPGEKVLSCGTGQLLKDNGPSDPAAPPPNYIEYSGTSMAAPHVSGCIASFLSVKREFIGRPDRIKEVFLATATDLGRERSFQGAGLVDLMRAIQYV